MPHNFGTNFRRCFALLVQTRGNVRFVDADFAIRRFQSGEAIEQAMHHRPLAIAGLLRQNFGDLPGNGIAFPQFPGWKLQGIEGVEETAWHPPPG